MQTVDTPNLVIPLGSSYNERGVAGYTHTVTNSEDQRKINCFYEPVKNAVTGKGTLTLSKRPGVTDSSGGATYGQLSTQSVWLIISEPFTSIVGGKETGSSPPWVISTNAGGSVIVSSATVDTQIVAGAGRVPAYVDRTAISLTDTIVLQLRAPSSNPLTSRDAWFSSAIATWTQITDADFVNTANGPGKMEFIDGFAFIMNTSSQIFNSDNNSLANWTVTSFITKQIAQDVAVGLARWKNQLLAFSEQTVEIFYNAGNATGSPLGRIPTLSNRVGLITPATDSLNAWMGHYYCTIGDKLFFVGRSEGGISHASAYAYDGQNFDKISNPYIDKILSQVVGNSFYSVNVVGFQGQKAMAILLTSPNATSQRWLMFFPEWKEWFEWTSTVFSPINSGEHFLSCGASLKDKIYNFTASDNWQDAGTSYPSTTQFRLPSNGAQRKFMLMYGLDADTDSGGIANTLTVEASDDDCVTFSTLGNIDLAADRKILTRGGSFRKRFMRIGNTNSRPYRIHNFLARIE